MIQKFSESTFVTARALFTLRMWMFGGGLALLRLTDDVSVCVAVHAAPHLTLPDPWFLAWICTLDYFGMGKDYTQVFRPRIDTR